MSAEGWPLVARAVCDICFRPALALAPRQFPWGACVCCDACAAKGEGQPPRDDRPAKCGECGCRQRVYTLASKNNREARCSGCGVLT